MSSSQTENIIPLVPINEAKKPLSIPLFQALFERKSEREYNEDYIIQNSEISSILFSAQGITHKTTKKVHDFDRRAVPSAGALYPLEIYIIIDNSSNLAEKAEKTSIIQNGIYKYDPESHSLLTVISGEGNEKENFQNHMQMVFNAGLEQGQIMEASAIMVICGVYDRAAKKYGKRAKRFSEFFFSFFFSLWHQFFVNVIVQINIIQIYAN